MLQSQVLNDAPGVFLVSLRVAHGDAAACAEQLAELNRRIERAAGFRSLDVIRRDGGLGTDFYILARFDSLDAVESWRASPERHALLPLPLADAASPLFRHRHPLLCENGDGGRAKD